MISSFINFLGRINELKHLRCLAIMAVAAGCLQMHPGSLSRSNDHSLDFICIKGLNCRVMLSGGCGSLRAPHHQGRVFGIPCSPLLFGFLAMKWEANCEPKSTFPLCKLICLEYSWEWQKADCYSEQRINLIHWRTKNSSNFWPSSHNYAIKTYRLVRISWALVIFICIHLLIRIT